MIATPTTGQTVNVLATTTFQKINPAGALAALTVAFPTPIGDGHEFNLTITQAITALTLTPSASATLVGGITSTGGYSMSRWKYLLADTTWNQIA